MRIRPISSRFDLQEIKKILFDTISAAVPSDQSIRKISFSSQVRWCEPGTPVLFLRRVEGSLMTSLPEPWLQGTLTDLPVLERAILHSLQMAQEDTAKWRSTLDDREI